MGNPQFLSLTLGQNGFDADYIKKLQETAQGTQSKIDDGISNYLSNYSTYAEKTENKGKSFGDYLSQLDEKSGQEAAQFFGATFTAGKEGKSGSFVDEKGGVSFQIVDVPELGNDKILSYSDSAKDHFTKGHTSTNPLIGSSEETKFYQPQNTVSTAITETTAPSTSTVATGTTVPSATTVVTQNTAPVKKEEKKENQPQVEYYDKGEKIKKSEVKQNEDGTTSKIRYSKNGEVVSESITNGNKKVADIKHNKDGSTQETKYDDKNRKESITEKDKSGNVTKTTEFTEDGSTETTKNKEGKEVVRTYDKDGTITGVTIGGEKAKGTAQENGDEDVEDATFVDAEKAAALLKNDDKLKAAVKGLEIKNGDKELTPDQINKAIQSGDLEVYQNEDGEYIVKSKVEDKKDKDGKVIEGEKSEKLGVGAKKDPYQKMMDSFMGDGSDPMKMMMGMMMMQMMTQMMGGGMMGQNPMAANMMNQFGAMSGQGQKPERETAGQAFADRGIESWFDGSRNSKARMLANKDSAAEKAELLRAKADYRRENGQPNWFQRNFLFKKTSDQLDAKAEKQDDKVAAIDAALA